MAPGDVARLRSGGRRFTVERIELDEEGEESKVHVVTTTEDGTFARTVLPVECVEVLS